jgi:hypothetical protein
MNELSLKKNGLGFEIVDGDRMAAFYRAVEELPRTESPKPCFAPIYTPNGGLVTEYRPADHAWHTGLYFGWVHVNDSNLWGGPWYQPDKEQYEYVDGTHGIQRHDEFTQLKQDAAGVFVEEKLTWLDGADHPMVTETRRYTSCKNIDPLGYHWRIQTRIEPIGIDITMGASRAARYSGLELRLGPPFADARHRSSEGQSGHENIMGSRARWVSAAGASGGEIVMMDHPDNPRHPVTWFTRNNLLGAGLLMEEDLIIPQGEVLELHYGLAVLDEEATVEAIETLYTAFCVEDKPAHG